MYLELQQLSKIASIPGIKFYSFQHRIDDDELQLCNELGIHHISHIDLFDDFDGLSAELVCMDVMIGISSFPIELAAALGVPVWMLGYSPENYFLRTNGGMTEEDVLTLNSTILAPSPIDFTKPQDECIASTLESVIPRLVRLRDKVAVCHV